ncbi:hypothetical protein D3C80_2008200 [compost metagenome]
MEAYAAFIGADCAVELYPVPAVNLYLAGFIYPRDPEGDGAFRLNKPLQNSIRLILRMA